MRYRNRRLRAWNRLQTDLKLLQSTDSFRRRLKHFHLSLFTNTKEQTDLLSDAPPSAYILVGDAMQISQLLLLFVYELAE